MRPTRRELLLASPFVASCWLAATAPVRAAEPETISFDGLYKSVGVLGLVFSDRARALDGHAVRMAGYLAPPLKAESDFFVLTREPLAICPFCQSDADWPVDIVVVYLAQVAPLVTAGAPLRVDGRLDIGSWTDPATGFVSQVRLRDARYRRA